MKTGEREASLKRATKETNIKLSMNLDRQDSIYIRTGLNFFDHMLEQIFFNACINVSLEAIGDLHIDEHHTVEDTGIAIGKALSEALGERKGIERYGFVLPMDESCSMVAIDLGGRADIVWDVPLKRERIGDVPTEMFKHFFKSLAYNAAITLHVRSYGENEHHIIESAFKGVGRALRMAIARDPRGLLPSTKGVI